MAEKQPSKWRRIPKMSFSSKDLSRRMKKVEGATTKHAHRFVFKRWSSFKESRRHVALWVLTIGLIIGAAGLQVLWYQQSYRTVANANDGTYAEGVLGPIDTLNPIFASSRAEESASALLFSRLLAYDTTGKLNYDLAENMTLSEDERTYRIKLRPDAQWEDGLYVRAKDVVFTVNTLKDPATRSTITGWNDIKVTEIDDRTVEFRLPAVYAAFPHALNYLPILPEHELRDVQPNALREHSFSNEPVTSGPFRLRFIQDIEQGTGRKIIHLARNENYYRGAPKLERFQLHVYESSEDIVRALNTSEVNAATDMTVSDTKSVNKERYTTERQPVNSGVYSLFNTTSGVMGDKRVRQAFRAGTDVEAIRKVVGEDTPALHLPFIADQVSGKLPGPSTFDQKQAISLLEKAGWKLEGSTRKKNGTDLKISLVTTKNADLENVLNELQKQWRELGASVTTSIVDPSDPSQNVVQNILQPRNYDALLYQLSIGGDPDVYAYWHSSQVSRGLNFSNYSSSVSDAALSSARTVIQKELRDAKYVTFAKQWMNDAPAIGLYQSTAQYAYSSGVHARPTDATLISSVDRFSDVLYWTVGNRIVHKTP